MKMKKKVVIILIALLVIILGYSYLGQPTIKTIEVKNSQYEDKASFKGVYFTQEFVVYRGSIDKKELQFKAGEKIPRGIILCNNIIAPQAGVVLDHIDGYESKFDVDSVFKYDNNAIEGIADKEQPGIKIINNSEWYVYAVTKLDKPFKRYHNYNLMINNIMYPSEVFKTEAKGKYTYTVFKIKNDLNILDLHRNINGYIIKSVYIGVVIPEKALTNINNTDGVLIKSHGYAEFRKVNIEFRGNGIAVVKPSETGKTIQDYDELITNISNVKDGTKIQ